MTTVPTRAITHAEFVHAPGERELAKELFSLLGCRVVDRGGLFFTAFVEPTEENHSRNVFYASEVTEEQSAFEQDLKAAAGAAIERFAAARRAIPQRAFHCGLRVPDETALDALISRVDAAAKSGSLAGRVSVAGTFRPEDPGALAPSMVQTFIWTDVVACGLLSLGQLIEVQWHLDPAS